MNVSHSSRTDDLPRIAIVGRPNVGKSTLFNRLIGHRRTITDPTPGVTRDAVDGVWRLAGRQVRVVDTGGYLRDSQGVDAAVAERSRDIIATADVVLLLLDVVEVTPEDEELIDLVRTIAHSPILVINKVDNEQRFDEAWNLHRYGFDRVVHISAEHKRNFAELEKCVVTALTAIDKPRGRIEESHDVRIALLGKPNTGKSTLLNRLVDFDRAIVSEIPGTTRDVLEGSFSYRGKRFLTLDTAGIRRKRSVTDSIEYYSVNRAIGSIERADVVLLVVDSTEGVAEQDKKIASQVIRRGKGIIIVLNKWDLSNSVPNALNALSDRTRFIFPVLSFAPICAVSALHDIGVSKTLDTVLMIWEQLQTEIGTGVINRSLAVWSDEHPIPHGGGHRYVARYMTQISSNPLRFVLFVNRTKGFPDTWTSYVKNRIREEYRLSSVPISVELRQS